MSELYDSEHNKQVQKAVETLKFAYLVILALDLANTYNKTKDDHNVWDHLSLNCPKCATV